MSATLEAAPAAAVDIARAALAEAVAREAALRAELAREREAAVTELDRARQYRVSLMQRRAKGDPPDAAELAEARADLAAAELRAEAATVDSADALAAAEAEVKHWTGTLVAALRNALRHRVALIHSAANAAERRLQTAQAAYTDLSNAEADCNRALGGPILTADPAALEGAIARCDAALARASAGL